jgi:two-component system cell cycle sensor histidine kinase/response regulator CckA
MIDVFLKKYPNAPTILVVEDEALLREMECSILEQSGYNVLSAESGRRAFDLWKSQGQKVDLLLADIILPRGITGVELGKCLLEGQPGLKIIFTTGRLVGQAEHEELARMNARFLPKPFQPEDLVYLVRDTLGAADSGAASVSVA